MNTEEYADMTLRDFFAAAALQGMNANPELMAGMMGTNLERMARKAYEQADAMLKERGRGKE
jgi:hypothetical protein